MHTYRRSYTSNNSVRGDERSGAPEVIIQVCAMCAPVRMKVVVQLRAGAAGTSRARRPEIVILAQALYSLLWHAHLHIGPLAGLFEQAYVCLYACR